MPRFVTVPADAGAPDDQWTFTLLEEVVAANLGQLFLGARVISSQVMRPRS